MEKKDLLIVAFVFGREYQGYIPLFLFSLYKHYPNYDAMIYVDSQLGKETQRLISLIPDSAEKYKIVLIDKIKTKLSPQQMKAYRWLVYDAAFEQYKYIYIGDIDIYICKETIPLHEQHIRHMKFSKLLYSNVVRSYEAPPKWIERHQSLLEKRNLYGLMKKIYNKYFYHKRLSGLHFVEVDAYYEAIKRQRERFFKVYYDTDIISKIYCLKMRRYSNEALLYYMIKKSHLKLPKQVESNANVLACNDMRSYMFRPYHGLHFGIWRNIGGVEEVYAEYLISTLNMKFYAQFKEELENDKILREIVEKSPVKVKRVINTMVGDMNGRIT